jgi:hypothetical protein
MRHVSYDVTHNMQSQLESSQFNILPLRREDLCGDGTKYIFSIFERRLEAELCSKLMRLSGELSL